MRYGLIARAALLLAAGASAATAQEDAGALDQMATDAEALIVASVATTRCALYDSSLRYLTPIELVGADIRLRQYEAVLNQQLEQFADDAAGVRERVSASPCGDAAFADYLDFARRVANDVVDIGLSALKEIDIRRCGYFVDDDFLAAFDNAKAEAETTTIEGDPARVAFITQNANAWISVFADNCFNLSFDPTLTLPGQIALAVPFAD